MGATATPDSVPNALYITDLSDRLAQIGSGSTYVIAELDGAYTKYKEVTTEAEWRGNVFGHQLFLRGSYTWSHYYGNVDQDGSTTAAATSRACEVCNSIVPKPARTRVSAMTRRGRRS